MSEYMRNDSTTIDLNFGLCYQAIAVAQFLYRALPHSFIDDDCATTISQAEGFEILTRPLLNGREKGLALIVRFYGKTDLGHLLLAEQVINFGESRGSDDIFVTWSPPLLRDDDRKMWDGMILDSWDVQGLKKVLGDGTIHKRRKSFREGEVGKTADCIVKLICKLYKKAKQVERKQMRKAS